MDIANYNHPCKSLGLCRSKLPKLVPPKAVPKPASKGDAAAPSIKGSLLPRGLNRTQRGVIPTRPSTKPLLPKVGMEKTSTVTATQMFKSRLTKPAGKMSRGKEAGVRKEAESKPANPRPQDSKQDAVQSTIVKDPDNRLK